jgi:hypothetical protein
MEFMPRIPVIFALLLVFSAVAGVGGWLLIRPPAVKRQPRPEPELQDENNEPANPNGKLVVLVVFDQMRGDYISRWAEHYGTDGFERIKKEGVWFSNCHIPYACTSTGPGHASLATGAPPSVHGIIENEWYDRKTSNRMYCCQPTRPFDLVPPVPPELGKPGRGSANGYSPERLLAQTVGDSLQEATKGKGRVFTLSIKDRTAVLMGGQKPNGAYCFDIRDGKFHTGAYYGRDAAHPWVTEFNNAKLVNTWFESKWEKFNAKIDYEKFSGPDNVEAEATGPNNLGRVFPHTLKGELTQPSALYYAAVECSPFGNDLLFDLTKRAIAAEKLGKGEAADLLMVSFSSTDLIGHIWGPDSQEVMDVTLRADKLVGDLLKHLDTTLGKDRYTVVVAADHGVCPLPEVAKQPGPKRAPFGQLYLDLSIALDTQFATGALTPTEWYEAFDDGVWPWIYLNRKAIESRTLKFDDVTNFTRDWLRKQSYLETAFTRTELEDGKFPTEQPLKKSATLAYHPDRCGDVIIVPKAGFLVTAYKGGTSHGSPHPYDTHIPFLAIGAGVPAIGKRDDAVSSLAVAPTLAHALGVPSPKHATTPAPKVITGEK